jgi:hypothetical protein
VAIRLPFYDNFRLQAFSSAMNVINRKLASWLGTTVLNGWFIQCGLQPQTHLGLAEDRIVHLREVTRAP